MPSSYIEEIYNFLDGQGVPIEAQWDQKCGPGVDSIESMEDVTQHGGPGFEVELNCCKGTDPDGIEKPFVETVGDVDLSTELSHEISLLQFILKNILRIDAMFRLMCT